ncbi:MAG: class I SAM-dependent methyltransferase, partial [bacterium]
MFGKIKSSLLYNANQNNEGSLSNKLRKKRLDFFLQFCNKLEKPLRIIDLGGSDYHWRNSVFKNNKDFYITIVNTEVPDLKDFRNVCFIKKNVRDLKYFDNNEYDIVYSNSLLEHLNKSDEQKNLAKEIKRIGKHYFIQTPNYYFPLEPHFLFPFFQFLPEKMKTRL